MPGRALALALALITGGLTLPRWRTR